MKNEGAENTPGCRSTGVEAMRHSLVVYRKLIWYEWELESKDWIFEILGLDRTAAYR